MVLLCCQAIIRRVREQWGRVGGRRQGERQKDGRPRKRQAHLSNCSIISFKGEGNDHESRKPQNTSRIAQSTLHKYPWGIVDLYSAAVFLRVSWIEPLTHLLSVHEWWAVVARMMRVSFSNYTIRDLISALYCPRCSHQGAKHWLKYSDQMMLGGQLAPGGNCHRYTKRKKRWDCLFFSQPVMKRSPGVVLSVMFRLLLCASCGRHARTLSKPHSDHSLRLMAQN